MRKTETGARGGSSTCALGCEQIKYTMNTSDGNRQRREEDTELGWGVNLVFADGVADLCPKQSL